MEAAPDRVALPLPSSFHGDLGDAESQQVRNRGDIHGAASGNPRDGLVSHDGGLMISDDGLADSADGADRQEMKKLHCFAEMEKNRGGGVADAETEYSASASLSLGHDQYSYGRRQQLLKLPFRRHSASTSANLPDHVNPAAAPPSLASSGGFLAHLGHHFSSEKKARPKNSAVALISSSSSSSGSATTASAVFSASNSPSRICRFCNREFPSGRALGGHMRIHGSLQISAPASLAESLEPKLRLLPPLCTSGSDPSETGDLGNKNCSEVGFASSRRIKSEESMANIIIKDDQQRTSAIIAQCDRSMNRRLKVETPSVAESEEAINSCKNKKRDRNSEVLSFSCKDPLNSDDLLQRAEQHGLLDIRDEVFQYGNRACPSFASQEGSPAAMKPHRIDPTQSRLLNAADQTELSDFPHTASADHDGNTNLANQKEHHNTVSSSTRSATAQSLFDCRCSECGKVFGSCKALFGHMRSHPEREWRGIQKPDSEHPDKAQSIKAGARKQINGESQAEQISGIQEAETADGCVEIIKQMKEAEQEEAFDGGEEEAEAKSNNVVQEDEERCMRESTSVVQILKAHSSWPMRKTRSQRTRGNYKGGFAVNDSTACEPGLTSETATSNELRSKCRSVNKDQEDLDMANCLVLLSNAGKVMREDAREMSRETTEESGFRKHLSSASLESSDEDKEPSSSDINNADGEDEAEKIGTDAEDPHHGEDSGGGPIKYECSTCKRSFNSHQALGGHRASHRKTKGCFARASHYSNHLAVEEVHENGEDYMSTDDEYLIIKHRVNNSRSRRRMGWVSSQQEKKIVNMAMEKPHCRGNEGRAKGHECSICHRVFPSGQALGGHKRCHWTGGGGDKAPPEVSTSFASSNNINAISKAHPQEQDDCGGAISKSPNHNGNDPKAKNDGNVLDLNLPAPLDHEDDETGYEADQAMEATNGAIYGTSADEYEEEEREDYDDAEDDLGSLAANFLDRTTNVEEGLHNVGGGSCSMRGGKRKVMASYDGEWNDHQLGPAEEQSNQKKKGACRQRRSFWGDQQWRDTSVVAAQYTQTCSMPPL